MNIPKGSSYASRTSAALSDRTRAIRRSKYISKRRVGFTQTIKQASYGKSIVAKLYQVTDANITAIADWDTVYGLVSLMQASNDWTNFRDSYALFNILNVTVKVLPQAWYSSEGINRVAGLAYDVKDNTALSTLKSVADHTQHKLMNFGATGLPIYIFSAKTKPTGYVPQKTSDNTENFGYIKAYADHDDFDATAWSIAKLEFCITVCFSSEQ